ncbi:polysaccharide deacetylase family protein [Legionella sp. km772]|uniref:polysaccharide deacetylase family protein n=1 Tax=Legionella sp. km772 TaxID=2498111 RepID=UPI000F8D6D3B|nr:polysaccharide deacetylase family protein [Legionella sp. km772]RUR10991.1 polysaccharide deacetylase [Legionella sp. km772]
MKINSLIAKTAPLVLFLFLLPSLVCAHKTVVITIDDLPFVGDYRNFHLNMIMETLQQQRVPATGFIIASEVRHDNWEMLHKFRDAGFGLGNHTFSHANLNRLSVAEYIQEIKKADSRLTPVLTKPKYFRYPYLAMSNGAKRNAILCYLKKKQYTVAPITIDSKDFVFNQRLLAVPELKRRDYFLQELKPFYLDFIWQQTLKAEEHSQYHHNPEQSQILLIHANLLNAYALPDIIKLYKEQGYKFVSLKKALKGYEVAMNCKPAKPAPPTVASPDPHIDSYVDWD